MNKLSDNFPEVATVNLLSYSKAHATYVAHKKLIMTTHVFTHEVLFCVEAQFRDKNSNPRTLSIIFADVRNAYDKYASINLESTI